MWRAPLFLARIDKAGRGLQSGAGGFLRARAEQVEKRGNNRTPPRRLDCFAAVLFFRLPYYSLLLPLTLSSFALFFYHRQKKTKNSTPGPQPRRALRAPVRDHRRLLVLQGQQGEGCQVVSLSFFFFRSRVFFFFGLFFSALFFLTTPFRPLSLAFET